MHCFLKQDNSFKFRSIYRSVSSNYTEVKFTTFTLTPCFFQWLKDPPLDEIKCPQYKFINIQLPSVNVSKYVLQAKSNCIEAGVAGLHHTQCNKTSTLTANFDRLVFHKILDTSSALCQIISELFHFIQKINKIIS